jgi:CBS domain-containing protein
MITVGDLMTRDLVTIREADDLALADSLFRLGAIRHLPVVRDRHLVGLVVPAQLLAAAAADPAAWRTRPVAEVMAVEPERTPPSTGLAEAARRMLARKVDCLAVCTGDGTLLGILTASDFVRFAADVVQDLDRVAEVMGQPPEAPTQEHARAR